MTTQPRTIFFDWPETLEALAKGELTQEELDTGIFLFDSMEYLDLEEIFVPNDFRFCRDFVAKNFVGEDATRTDAEKQQRATTEVQRFKDALEKAENEHRLHSTLNRVLNWGTIMELLEHNGHSVWPASEITHLFVRPCRLQELLTQYVPEARFVGPS